MTEVIKNATMLIILFKQATRIRLYSLRDFRNIASWNKRLRLTPNRCIQTSISTLH